MKIWKNIFGIRGIFLTYYSLKNRWNSSIAIAPVFMLFDKISNPRFPSPQNESLHWTIEKFYIKNTEKLLREKNYHLQPIEW